MHTVFDVDYQSCDLFTPLLFAMESELGAKFTKSLNLIFLG